MAIGVVFIFVLLLSVGGMFVLYHAIQRETRDLPRMSREEAERKARDEAYRNDGP
ncbi:MULTISPECIES: hypothetical protein [Haloferax]|uniref:Uncharacterized protein n=1 Tax=Haloferax mediterranei (strain ATCC 33500 / DSM 1411 / JCM 8866 / NBRC 14739 / NCIMB 2177 / R-4) TaxID=523841 RepID=M0J368_HALMT|nr:hypothetical protein [Haloferax mediterranei]EMA02444.1 hypothetical protein C439_07675 [Haloferax mediterranei ATCC 33500]MDX5988373.1 hypothetical protein [Haloferax mediterranei ATCC 33500]